MQILNMGTKQDPLFVFLNQAEDKPREDGFLHIFPRGEVYIEKYDKTFTFDDKFFNEIIESFKSPSLPNAFIDKDHWMEESYGEFTELEIREEGLFGKVELNALGEDAIGNKKYRFVSPAWGSVIDNNKKRWNNYLMAVALTNIPALLGLIAKLQEQFPSIVKKMTEEAKKAASLAIQEFSQGNEKEAAYQIVELFAASNIGVGVLKGHQTEPTKKTNIKTEDSMDLMQLIDAIKAKVTEIMAMENYQESEEWAAIVAMVEELAGLIGKDTEEPAAAASAEKAKNLLTAMVKGLKAEKAGLEQQLSVYKENELKNQFEETFVKTNLVTPAERDELFKEWKANRKGIELALKGRTPHNLTTTLGNEPDQSTLSDDMREIAEAAGYDLSKPEDRKEFAAVSAELKMMEAK